MQATHCVCADWCDLPCPVAVEGVSRLSLREGGEGECKSLWDLLFSLLEGGGDLQEKLF